MSLSLMSHFILIKVHIIMSNLSLKAIHMPNFPVDDRHGVFNSQYTRNNIAGSSCIYMIILAFDQH